MKKLMLRLLAVAAFVASVSVSCSEVSFIDINPPADLQSKIDSIQALKDAQNTGDKTMIDIAVAEVGAKDYTSGWWVDFSQYFTEPVQATTGATGTCASLPASVIQMAIQSSSFSVQTLTDGVTVITTEP